MNGHSLKVGTKILATAVLATVALLSFPLLALSAEESAKKAGAEDEGSGFVLVDEDIEKLNEKLLAQEQALLERLKSNNPDIAELTVEPANVESSGLAAEKESPPKADLQRVKHTLPPATELPEPRSTITDPVKTAAVLSPKVQELKSQQDKLQEKISDNEKSLASLQRSKSALQSKLAATEKRVAALLRELEEARDKLLVAETEVERLSHMISVRNIKMFGDDVNPRKVLSDSLRARHAQPLSTDPEVIKKSQGMPIVTVVSRKANLRTGPGTGNSPLMQVTKGTRLAVETRQGSWYRVIAPTGERAYISSDTVRFGKSLDSSPTDTLSVRGYDEQADAEAFGLIRGHAR